MADAAVSPNSSPVSSRTATIAAWTLQVLLAAAFLAAGGAKLAGVPMMVQTFEGVGVGQWFRYVTGAIEVGSAVALLVPGFAAFGAALLACTMTGAVLTHLFLIGGPPAPAAVLLVLTLIVLWLRRDQFPRRLRG